jgi:alanine racemase
MDYRISRAELEELARNITVLRERTEDVCKEFIATMKAGGYVLNAAKYAPAHSLNSRTMVAKLNNLPARSANGTDLKAPTE